VREPKVTDQIPVLIRALRDYVASGIIWILVIWTVFSNSFGHATRQGDTLASVYQPLIPAIQNISSLVALCAIAAVLGSVSIQVFRAPAIWLCNLCVVCMTKVEHLFITVGARYRTESTVRRFRDRETIPVDIARRYLANHRTEIEAAAGAASVNVDRLKEVIYHKVDELHWKLIQGPEQPNPMISDSHGQSLFRLCLVVPLLCLSIALAIRVSPGYLIVAAAPLVIAFQASDYRFQRDQLLYEEFDNSISFDEIARRLNGILVT
jgi:hypothetical protein